jgi:hypothetical protein
VSTRRTTNFGRDVTTALLRTCFGACNGRRVFGRTAWLQTSFGASDAGCGLRGIACRGEDRESKSVVDRDGIHDGAMRSLVIVSNIGLVKNEV